MKEGLSPAFSSSSHTQPARRAPNDSQPHLEEAGEEAGPVCAASRTSPRSPHPCHKGWPHSPPSQVTLGDKVPEMAFKDVSHAGTGAEENLHVQLGRIQGAAPPRGGQTLQGGGLGDSLGGSGGPRGCAEAEAPVHAAQTCT